MRLDKWLWAARFYKTRQMAVEAINGGHVHLNQQRAKPGKEVRIGSQVTINKDGLEWAIEILVLPKQRRPASEAAGFYSESETGKLKRQTVIEERKLQRLAAPVQTPGRPTKRDRRLIHRFKQDQ